MERESVYGPYKHRRSWRVEVHITKGDRREKTRRTFATEDEAREFKRTVEREIAKAQNADTLRAKAEELRRLADQYAVEADRRDGRGLTVGEAMERYKAYMLHDKGNKPRSVETTGRRLIGFLGDTDAYLSSITERKAEQLYAARRPNVSVDTHRNELGQTKTFMNWCVEQGWIRRNPFDKVKAVGKRNRGKKQLRLEETRRLVTVALAEARVPDEAINRRRDAQHRESSLAVLVALYLALRAGEVVGIERRDVDDGGRLLWIPDSKSDNGRRTLEVADVLRPLLWKHALACEEEGGAEARLFPHDRSWVLYNVKRLCRRAGVPEVTTHATRGIHATIATQVGTTSHIVAKALGHGSAEVTKRHYIRRGASEQASRERLRDLLRIEPEGPSDHGRWGKRDPKSFP